MRLSKIQNENRPLRMNYWEGDVESESAFTQKIWVIQLERMNSGFVRYTSMTNMMELNMITYFILF